MSTRIALIILCLLTGAISGVSPHKIAAQSGNPGIVHFAVIGDFGNGGSDEGNVAKLVKSWRPDFVTTVGDNNYAGGRGGEIDRHVGKFYSEYIYPYQGAFGAGGTVNRFWPILGNHDWQSDEVLRDYLDYFTLPGNERYYDYAYGSIHLFMLDGDEQEPDGNTADSIQGKWLKSKLAAATEPWKLIYIHEPPFSSGVVHGSKKSSRWPFQAWGATAVFSGDDHTYERIVINDFVYFINGLGGVSKYNFKDTPIPGSQVRYNSSYGAQLVTADNCHITFEFYSLEGGKVPIDSYTIDGCSTLLN